MGRLLWLGWLLLAIAAVPAVGMIYQWIGALNDRRRFLGLGRMVDVGNGRRMYVSDMGRAMRDGPTVIGHRGDQPELAAGAGSRGRVRARGELRPQRFGLEQPKRLRAHALEHRAGVAGHAAAREDTGALRAGWAFIWRPGGAALCGRVSR